jgi:hypothetical protein
MKKYSSYVFALLLGALFTNSSFASVNLAELAALPLAEQSGKFLVLKRKEQAVVLREMTPEQLAQIFFCNEARTASSRAWESIGQKAS